MELSFLLAVHLGVAAVLCLIERSDEKVGVWTNIYMQGNCRGGVFEGAIP